VKVCVEVWLSSAHVALVALPEPEPEPEPESTVLSGVPVPVTQPTRRTPKMEHFISTVRCAAKCVPV
jgi:hypothetical protein